MIPMFPVFFKVDRELSLSGRVNGSALDKG